MQNEHNVGDKGTGPLSQEAYSRRDEVIKALIALNGDLFINILSP